jgi:HD-GYP domain-containing protein (c-di-GMP phosphodiesterase class II)
MLTVPMTDACDDVIGVIQLINKKRDPKQVLKAPGDFERDVEPFDAKSVRLARALAAQAGVSLENALLNEEVRELFEGFVHASVIAIESRDPTTSGHSQRVATLTVGLAQAIDRVETGPFAELRFSADNLKQIEYAGLLHDFGKVGVRESVLVKAKKLYEPEQKLIAARFDYIRKALEAESLRKKCGADRSAWAAIDEELQMKLSEVDRFLGTVLSSNEPTVLPKGGFEALAEIAAQRYVAWEGQEQPYLSKDEVAALSIPKGTLTDVERVEIERHVTHTYNFLRKIPWGKQFKEIPLIAGSHHETLDGRGYPRHLIAGDIPVEAKMMSISDIFDALTASDRPYKKALPKEKALAIIESEVKSGRLDAGLFAVFVEAKVFERVF